MLLLLLLPLKQELLFLILEGKKERLITSLKSQLSKLHSINAGCSISNNNFFFFFLAISFLNSFSLSVLLACLVGFLVCQSALRRVLLLRHTLFSSISIAFVDVNLKTRFSFLFTIRFLFSFSSWQLPLRCTKTIVKAHNYSKHAHRARLYVKP